MSPTPPAIEVHTNNYSQRPLLPVTSTCPLPAFIAILSWHFQIIGGFIFAQSNEESWNRHPMLTFITTSFVCSHNLSCWCIVYIYIYMCGCVCSFFDVLLKKIFVGLRTSNIFECTHKNQLPAFSCSHPACVRPVPLLYPPFILFLFLSVLHASVPCSHAGFAAVIAIPVHSLFFCFNGRLIRLNCRSLFSFLLLFSPLSL